MGTSRRSICDHYIFRKYTQKYPRKPLKFGRKSPGKPWKRFHFTVGHPVCGLLRFIIISGVHDPYSLSTNVHFDTGIVKMLKSVSTGPNKFSYKIKGVFETQLLSN